MSLQRLLRTIGVLALVGLGISLYLTWVYTTDRVAICLGSGGCETVQYSPYAWILGIPIPTLGAGAYLMVLALAVLGLRGSQPAEWVVLALFGTALVGLLFSAYLTYLELFVIHAICLWCAVSAVIQLFLFTLAVVVWRRFQEAV
ncbi:vitamin K epoxide reductase family protein [Symbiobacterium thermophilum]|uniref:Vitamin K epoxide reductase domain-containing protein n=1 Tax=Symbiobacterium thermophilum (strain DSM 24528 / JCM 14929 / IAM 14863 / T) TaxID=292459 RepID=Q67L97_SYMTH|nr:vitamin K epoxide reductase family protein [Symbiobacterium thermophilum]BAD41549.1 conserved hypothetical protein [Symbiobacterium thermophilum IAM 14863]